VKVNLLLADTARIAEGKLDALGVGWAVIVPGAPFTVCGVVHVPWHQGTELHTLTLELLDGDGEPFCLPVEEGEPQPFRAEFKQDKPLRETVLPHIKPGTALTWPFFLALGGFPLQPGMLYEWRLPIDGHHEEDWTLPFRTLSPPQPPEEMPEAA